MTRVFDNGDKYTGGWKAGRPQGEGTYIWFDGSIYKGSWKAGRKDGIGTYTWANGGRYHGEWKEGTMSGVGTLENPDGTSYQGGCFHDMKQGLGRKVFPSGDVYEGLWKQNKFHGPGQYRWIGGDEYDGQWNLGAEHGRGTLRWRTGLYIQTANASSPTPYTLRYWSQESTALQQDLDNLGNQYNQYLQMIRILSGDRYDGQFEDGLADGIGVFTWKSGSTYEGYWKEGKKHGVGVYRPAFTDVLAKEGREKDEREECDEIQRQTEETKDEDMLYESLYAQHSEPPLRRRSLKTLVEGDYCSAPKSLRALREEKKSNQIWLREYDQGKLIRMDLLTAKELEAVFGKDDCKTTFEVYGKGRKNSSRNCPGEGIISGHQSYDLMLDLQLGIRFSLGRVSATDNIAKTLKRHHFKYKRMQMFPTEGSSQTPPHPTADFSWKDYCPAAFKKLRDVFNIPVDGFLRSLCGDDALRDIPSLGKSGSIFFLSHDGKYIIKTMRKGEIKLLLKLLPRYVEHIQRYPHTLLVKFYGLYRVIQSRGPKVRFIVMNNLFPTNLAIHRKYDLKGSTLGRFCDQEPGPNMILKDQDLDLKLRLGIQWTEKLLKQLEIDCALLEELQVMDYSLLLGIHLKSTGHCTRQSDVDKTREETSHDAESGDGISRSADLISVGTSPSTAMRGGSFEPWEASSPIPEASCLYQKLEHQHSARWRQRIQMRLGSGVEEQKIEDLLKMAHCRMLSKEGRAKVPSTVLVSRSLGGRLSRSNSHSKSVASDDELAHRLGGFRVQLGLNMKASCLLKDYNNDNNLSIEGVCYFGIIDILQEYNVSKRVEHGFKSLRHGSEAISAVDPVAYSRRFKKFMMKIFQ